MLRAMIVDDEELAVNRLKNILYESDEIEVCHTFLNPWEAYEFAKENPIQLAFLDISMPEIDGMKLSGLLLGLDASINIIFVTGYDKYAVQAFDMSALDYLMKPIAKERVWKTLDKIKKRQRSEAAVPFKEVIRGEQKLLTEQEMRIVRLVTDGLTNKEIAYQLDISAETVKSHIKNVYRKLNINNRVQVLQRAKELDILM